MIQPKTIRSGIRINVIYGQVFVPFLKVRLFEKPPNLFGRVSEYILRGIPQINLRIIIQSTNQHKLPLRHPQSTWQSEQ